MLHLTQRVAWHDRRWDGTVCDRPSRNSFCIALDRIRVERKDLTEDGLASKSWAELKQNELPPCKAESGGFMNTYEWSREFRHPYKDIKEAAKTHSHLKPTIFKVPSYSTFAVPFWWMLNEHQKEIDDSTSKALPLNDKAPFATSWVFSRDRQDALLNLFFGKLVPEHSLAFFYCKEGQPLGDFASRLIVGIGRILSINQIFYYETDKKASYPIWDRIIQHSIRPEGVDGFLLPYHEYLIKSGDSDEDERRLELLREIAIVPDVNQFRFFSYGSELAKSDTAISILIRALSSIRKIKDHGIAEGPWDKHEEWINRQIAHTWKDRGAFPGIGSVLEALGMRLGTSLYLELLASGRLKADDDPWEIMDHIIKGKQEPPNDSYKADIEAIRLTWISLLPDRRKLIKLLSRFDLSPSQASRWFNKEKRGASIQTDVNDEDIIENPYVIFENDLGDDKEPSIPIGIIDRGLLPDHTIRARHPIPEPSLIESYNDGRRIKAVLVSVLREAGQGGDTLLSVTELLKRTSQLDLSHQCEINLDWINAHKEFLQDSIEVLDFLDEKNQPSIALQLTEVKEREERLRKILRARASREIKTLDADWTSLLKQAIIEANSNFDDKNARHMLALREQADALERITVRKLTCLIGKAGTGKTSVLGALLRCDQLKNDGILLLAPTGKARIRLAKATSSRAMTIAQFLNSQGRYDVIRQRPLFEGTEKYRREKTVVIDECSMLTMDDLCAVFDALDMAHVTRIILVGDPNQLPPIGIGRPFADFVGFLDKSSIGDSIDLKPLSGSLARLTVEVRASSGKPSDTLRLSSWFTGEPQLPDSDRILSELEYGQAFNDLEICFWQTPEELKSKLLEQLQNHLGMASSDDVIRFNSALGINEKGWIPYDYPDDIEKFQILSPVRMHPHGVYALNRWIQWQFRREEVQAGRHPWGTILGDEDITIRDKVIQNVNQVRSAYDHTNGRTYDDYLANGEVGVVTKARKGYLNVLYSGRPNVTFSYNKRDFPGGKGPIELAYALTIHKAQGSEFQKVFVVLPKGSRLISRELIYTALTRSREQLVLLIEGNDVSFLYELTKPEKSETFRRNTNLFETVVREEPDMVPYAEHLIHRTEKGHMVRSKSELVIANMLYQMNIPYVYERKLDGINEPGSLRPDFTFIDPSGDVIILEHLGMLYRADYRRSWEWKQEWYAKNGYEVDQNLFTTYDDERGGLDSGLIKRTATRIKSLL